MPPIRHLRAACLACLFVMSSVAPAAAVTATGRLQVIHLDVGQGDGALIISPLGQTVLIDEGPSGASTAMGVSVVNQLLALGVTHVDYHFASHYHSDHIGNIGAIVAAGITIGYGWDRGGSYSSGAYTNYVSALGSKRRTLAKNQVVMLDSLSAHPVRIKCVDLNGAGIVPTPTDENSMCLSLKVSYGEFDEVFGGDLTGGAEGGASPDIESRVAAAVGPVEVYKVHHHGSRFSSNVNYLNATLPKVAVISCGNGNGYGHPTAGALSRLHGVGTKTYWTETGAGVAPNAAYDKVSSGQVRISAGWDGAEVDTIRGTGFADTFINSGSPSVDAVAPVANLTSPDGGEVWKAGSSRAVTWSASDNVGVSNVDVAWSSDGGAVWYPIASAIANTGSYSWQVPATATTTGRVKVTARDAADNLGADASLSSFSIDWWTIAASAGVGGTITPAGVLNVSEGATAGFAIAPAGGFQLAGLTVDGASLGALGAYQFNSVAAHHTISASFLDVAAPVVAVTSPAGGEAWAQGSAHDVTWTASDNQSVDSVSVEYSAHGASGPWVLVARALANNGVFAWTVPAFDSDSALVRVTAYDPALNTGIGVSAGLFQLGSGTLAVGETGPVALRLEQPSPNPSVGPTRMGFSLPQAGPVRLEVFDLSGRRVWSHGGVLAAGRHSLIWDGRLGDGTPAGGGLFFVRLVTPWGTLGARLARLR